MEKVTRKATKQKLAAMDAARAEALAKKKRLRQNLGPALAKTAAAFADGQIGTAKVVAALTGKAK